ncbi:MAG: hypothetical protein HYX34_06685 [Actinobacteria bacterium]|nr:hypothetical protein [Actinomycetota bacterium]
MERFDDEDPGWRSAGHVRRSLLVPGTAAGAAQDVPDGLVVVRRLFVVFALGLVLMGVPVAILAASGGAPAGSSAAPGLALVLVGSLVQIVASRVIRLPLDGRDAQALASSYRNRFFVRLALAEVSPLLGFVASILSGRAWLYAVGVAIAAFGFAEIAPTARKLAADQDDLNNRGCGLSLVWALRRPSGT